MSYITAEGYSLKIDDVQKVAAIISRHNSDKDLYIPKEIQGYTIISIMRNAFPNDQELESVIIPETIQFIGASAFKNSGLKHVYFADRTETPPVCKIYNSAFMGCKNLEKVSLRKNIEFADWAIFSDCINLHQINSKNIKDKIPTFTFQNCSQLKNFSVSTPICVEANAFEGVNFTSFYETGGNGFYAEDFFKTIKNAEIVCSSDSLLSPLAYYGYNVKLRDYVLE